MGGEGSRQLQQTCCSSSRNKQTAQHMKNVIACKDISGVWLILSQVSGCTMCHSLQIRVTPGMMSTTGCARSGARTTGSSPCCQPMSHCEREVPARGRVAFRPVSLPTYSRQKHSLPCGSHDSGHARTPCHRTLAYSYETQVYLT
jgi:hypothetical protein